MRNTRKSGQRLRSKKRPHPTLRSGRGSRTNSNTSRQIPARVIEADSPSVVVYGGADMPLTGPGAGCGCAHAAAMGLRGAPRPHRPICDPALTPTKCSAFISLDPAIVLYVRYPHLIKYRQAVGLSESCP